jgi:hypothetical protein
VPRPAPNRCSAIPAALASLSTNAGIKCFQFPLERISVPPGQVRRRIDYAGFRIERPPQPPIQHKSFEPIAFAQAVPAGPILSASDPSYMGGDSCMSHKVFRTKRPPPATSADVALKCGSIFPFSPTLHLSICQFRSILSYNSALQLGTAGMLGGRLRAEINRTYNYHEIIALVSAARANRSSAAASPGETAWSNPFMDHNGARLLRPSCLAFCLSKSFG